PSSFRQRSDGFILPGGRTVVVEKREPDTLSSGGPSMSNSEQQIPRVFISYSWTSHEHIAWVTEFANRLMANGVDVVFDRWDVREGNDLHSFMEKMVLDPTIKRVLMICDKKYTEKANSRTGGVGKESLIISAEVYRKTDQGKFIPIV